MKKYWSYIYEIKHIPTKKLYVGSRSTQKLKNFEDCYTDKYMGSSAKKEGPFSKIDIQTNPQNYQKTVLKVFYSEDAKLAWKNENGINGLIMTYWQQYGKDICINESCFLNNENRFFNNAGNKQSDETKDKISKKHKGRKHSEQSKKNMSNAQKGKTHSDETKQKMSNIHKGENNGFFGKTHSENIKENISNKIKELYKNDDYMLKMRLANKLQANLKYKCPYDSYISNARGISVYIKNNYPFEKQWISYSKEEKKYFIVS